MSQTKMKGEQKFLQEVGVHDGVPAAAGLEMVRLKPAQLLFQQGDVSDAMYIVASGQVDVTVTGQDGKERVLCTREPGAIFGEISLLLDELRTATVVARSNAELWRISRDDFEAGLRSGDSWTHRFLLVMAQKLAGRLVDLNQEVLALVEETGHAKMDDNVNVVKVAELEQLRDRLFTHWSF